MIPHVDNNLLVCTLRRDTTVNPDKAVEVLEECLAIAKDVLDREWTIADVQDHVGSELSAYWRSNEAGVHQLLFQPNVLDQTTFRVDPMVLGAELYKISPIDSAKDFHVESSGVGIVIDIPESDIIPLVQQRGEYVSDSASAIAAISEFATNVPSWVSALKRINIYFAFRCRLKSGVRVLCGRLKEKVLLKKKSPDQVVAAIRQALRHQMLQLCKAEDTSFERLIRRSKGKIAQDISHFRIAIIGCGSLGSFLADNLSRTGIRNFFLCDDENVEVGNVARHLSSLHLVGQRKTFAVAFKLRERFEDLNITECRHDFRVLEAQSALEAFNPHLIIFATGDTNTDLTGSRLVSEGKIGAACFVWGETGLSAGHLIFQPKESENILLELHSKDGDEGKYCHRIEKDALSSLEQESGCPVVYSPYSGHDMALFAALSAKRIISWVLNEREKGCVLRMPLSDLQPWEELHG